MLLTLCTIPDRVSFGPAQTSPAILPVDTVDEAISPTVQLIYLQYFHPIPQISAFPTDSLLQIYIQHYSTLSTYNYIIPLPTDFNNRQPEYEWH